MRRQKTKNYLTYFVPFIIISKYKFDIQVQITQTAEINNTDDIFLI